MKYYGNLHDKNIFDTPFLFSLVSIGFKKNRRKTTDLKVKRAKTHIYLFISL